MTKTRGVPGRSFEYKIGSPTARAEVGRRVAAGERVEAVAAAYGISATTARRYAAKVEASR
ncbi:hypothetical protein [[Mycobacterium] burgundiense]|uniref:Resolvase HTH domain-containing protein n=1 Tax=[Mycobacterium] burgundiense TaxID=3064286 RepID=A0ABN9NEZ6_9MYCO|nr:hypothetical protein [Mycolicibacterium sp. MU0053]CAJ1505237.1 hypothetical protein MU0053_002884 [Mycolicibacterium sp. MU0053]